jgi:protein SCO1/2
MKIQVVRNLFAGILLYIVMVACSQRKQEEKLPIFGYREVIAREVDGKKIADTVYHTIADFEFVNQDSAVVTNATFKDKIYVTDFFFTTCRTICPKMKTQMLRVYDSIQNMPDVFLLSHSIDPEHDSVALLHDFAERLGVSSNKWHFVTGDQEKIFAIAQTSYFATAMVDTSEPDGFIHSGAFLLLDKQQRIRGKYDGTLEEDVNRLLIDIKRLQKEYEK